MVQAVSEKISELNELIAPTAEMQVPVVMGGSTYRTSMSNLLGSVFDVRSYGATVSGGAGIQTAAQQAAANVLAIQAAIDAAEIVGGVVTFPGGPQVRYPISGQLTVAASNVWLWAPGGAKLLLYSAIPMPIAVGDIETGVNLTQGNALASNAAAGATSITLATGKGANIAAGSWIVIKSTAVVPEHDTAVVNKCAEFVNVYSVAGDVITLNRPLRFTYNTADTAEVWVVSWIENFGIIGLGIDGNNQIACSTGVQMSWCLNPFVSGIEAVNLQQRFVRFQGCRGHVVSGLRQRNGLSNGYNGDSGHFAYMLAEQGLNEGLIASDLVADRVRHGYTTGAGWTSNSAVTSVILSGIGVPMNSIVGPGQHSNARGAGWDTHEVGMDITFRDLKTIGSLQVGFQVRSVRTRFKGDCFARDCVGAALQIGADAQDSVIGRNLDWQSTNLGTDQEGSTDWTIRSPIVDNSLRSILGEAAPNELDNGNFDLWERGTSFTATGGTANRWKMTLGGGATVTTARGTHTLGGATNLPDMGAYYLRFSRSVTGAAASTVSQYIDNVRSYAGQRVVVSFDARASVASSNIRVWLRQAFGTGGSPSADVDTAISTRVIADSWDRHCLVIDVPSLSGKTVGSNEDSSVQLIFELPTAAGNIFVDLDRVKLEIGRVPTDFVPESLATTADRCKRWYEKSYTDGVAPATSTSVGAISVIAPVAGSSYGRAWVPFAARKGRIPTIAIYSTDGTVASVRNVTTGPANIAGAVTDSSGAQLNGWYGGANAAGVNVGDLIKWQWTAAVADFE